MEYSTLITLSCLLSLTAAWSVPFYPVPGPPRITRYAPHPVYQNQRHRPHPVYYRNPEPIRVAEPIDEPIDEKPQSPQRPKRDHDYDFERDQDHHGTDTHGTTGPVHTFVKTDKNANYKWGVRHHVGNKFSS